MEYERLTPTALPTEGQPSSRATPPRAASGRNPAGGDVPNGNNHPTKIVEAGESGGRKRQVDTPLGGHVARITIDDAVHRLLKAEKHDDETMSQLLRRLLDQKHHGNTTRRERLARDAEEELQRPLPWRE